MTFLHLAIDALGILAWLALIAWALHAISQHIYAHRFEIARQKYAVRFKQDMLGLAYYCGDDRAAAQMFEQLAERAEYFDAGEIIRNWHIARRNDRTPPIVRPPADLNGGAK